MPLWVNVSSPGLESRLWVKTHLFLGIPACSCFSAQLDSTPGMKYHPLLDATSRSAPFLPGRSSVADAAGLRCAGPVLCGGIRRKLVASVRRFISGTCCDSNSDENYRNLTHRPPHKIILLKKNKKINLFYFFFTRYL